jgi:hypothetical protein
VHKGTLHLPTTAHLPRFISFRGKNHVRYFLNRPRITSHILWVIYGHLFQVLGFRLEEGILSGCHHSPIRPRFVFILRHYHIKLYLARGPWPEIRSLGLSTWRRHFVMVPPFPLSYVRVCILIIW